MEDKIQRKYGRQQQRTKCGKRIFLNRYILEKKEVHPSKKYGIQAT